MARLAIENGKAVRRRPFPPRIMFDEEEKRAVIRIIERGMKEATPSALDRYGPEQTEVDLYEREFAAYFGIKYATAVSSGTAAIHSALGALKLEPGDEVITSPITDPGTIAPILFQNCIPVFADVDYQTLNISSRSIEERITEKTKVIIPVHLAGQPADMDLIMDIARKYRLVVIEDCAQAHGAKYRGRYVSTMGDMGCFSLMSGKHMTSAGQGGMVVTNDENLYWNAKRFADRGKPFNSSEEGSLFLGLNYRMTQLEAAIGRTQLRKLDRIGRKRRQIAQGLRGGMEKLLSVKMWVFIEDVQVNPWFCFLRYDKDKMRVDKETFAKAVRAEGIPVGAHYVRPMYQYPWLRDKNSYGRSACPWRCHRGRDIDYTNCCPIAEKSLDDHMTLHIHEGWTGQEIDDTLRAIRKVEEVYKR